MSERHASHIVEPGFWGSSIQLVQPSIPQPEKIAHPAYRMLLPGYYVVKGIVCFSQISTDKQDTFKQLAHKETSIVNKLSRN